jgi:plastocyanin
MTAAVAAAVTGSVELTDSHNTAARKRKDFSGVVIWLEPLNGQALQLAPRRVEMLQKDKKFIPHVLAIPVGSQVDFPNYDLIFHNAFSKFNGQPFDVGLYPPGTSKSITFTRPGIVHVFCNIHQTMSAVIVVLRTPWFAVTNVQGAFSIPGVPAGEYRLHVFHERATEEQLKALDRTVTVGDAAVALPVVSISEAGYLPAPHKNKFGADYPPQTDDHTFYPGVRK